MPYPNLHYAYADMAIFEKVTHSASTGRRHSGGRSIALFLSISANRRPLDTSPLDRADGQLLGRWGRLDDGGKAHSRRSHGRTLFEAVGYVSLREVRISNIAMRALRGSNLINVILF